jgi:hypothetical protein
MRRARLSLRLVLVAALPALAAGCGLVADRPYAHDPILRERTPVWGDHGRARSGDFTPIAEPVPPPAPDPRELVLVAEARSGRVGSSPGE